MYSGPQTKQWKLHSVSPSAKTSFSGQRYSSWTWMETAVSTLTLLMNRTHTHCPLGSSDPCTSSSLRTRESVWAQPVCVLSQAESGRVHADLPAGSSVWSSQPVPQSAAGTVCVCVFVCVCVCVCLCVSVNRHCRSSTVGPEEREDVHTAGCCQQSTAW